MSRKPILSISIIAVLMAACRTATDIVSPQAPVEAPAATATQDAHPDWLAYHDDLGRFTIKHPPTWERWDSGGYPVTFGLSLPPDTTLGEKMMKISVTQGMITCSNPNAGGSIETTPPQTWISAGGISWFVESGGDAGAGNVYDLTSYSTLKDGACISITFVLHSTNPMMYESPPPEYDEAAESAVFKEMLNTFRFDP